MSADVEARLYRAESWLKRARDSSDHLDGQFIFHWIGIRTTSPPNTAGSTQSPACAYLPAARFASAIVIISVIGSIGEATKPWRS